ncbi:hypothetical protein Tco_1070669 [Tanacetum coccineum]|uniref:DUF4062 domain-containing protein n=1 Tax=Tanacetum coccineum TaxID=301880 RepID=A0ABQ5HM38_9ASTR
MSGVTEALDDSGIVGEHSSDFSSMAIGVRALRQRHREVIYGIWTSLLNEGYLSHRTWSTEADRERAQTRDVRESCDIALCFLLRGRYTVEWEDVVDIRDRAEGGYEVGVVQGGLDGMSSVGSYMENWRELVALEWCVFSLEEDDNLTKYSIEDGRPTVNDLSYLDRWYLDIVEPTELY